MQRLVEISGLNVRYSGVHALDNVSFTVDDGDFLGVIGPNGAGKSTLFSCMLGINTNYTGIVKMFGQDVRKSKGALRNIGYVPQSMRFEKNFPITVREVIRLGMWHKTANEDRIDEVMQELWIHELEKRRIGELSKGQQQRVFIAKAIVNDPKLLVLDEPVTGVDQASSTLFYGILKDLNSNHGITIVWSSHDLESVNMLANRIACIDQRMHFHGPAEQFFADEGLVRMHSEGSMHLHMKNHRSHMGNKNHSNDPCDIRKHFPTNHHAKMM